MPSLRSGPHGDGEFDVGVEVVRDNSNREGATLREGPSTSSPPPTSAGLISGAAAMAAALGGLVVSTPKTAVDSAGPDPEAGWHTKKLAILGHAESDGVRSIERDKEYGFRPKIAHPQKDSTIYRDHRDPPGSSTVAGDEEKKDLTSILVGGAAEIASISLGIPHMGVSPTIKALSGGAISASPGGTSPSSNPWSMGPDDPAIEYGIIADDVEPVKSSPDWNPLHYGGKNRSTLIHGKLTSGDDDDIDFPRRYFGRSHDLTLVKSTQKIDLSRVKHGPSGHGFFKKKASTETYEDGSWKAMLNITPKDNPPSKEIDQPFQGVHDTPDTKKGKHGYGAHAYNQVISASLSLPTDRKLLQGGWVYDGLQDIAGMMFHDVMGIEAGVGKRYEAKDGFKIGTGYIRDDARFGKDQSLIGRVRFMGVGVATEPGGIKFWADHFMDLTKKNSETDVYHETGEWRVIYQIPEH